MTPNDIEAMIKNLDTRTTRIEQILPTLATKDDLAAGLNGLGARLGGVETRLDGVETRLGRVETGVDALKSQMLVLHENVKDDYRLLAEHLAGVPNDIRRLSEQVAVIPELKGEIRRLTENVARTSQDLTAEIGRLAQKIDGSPRRRR